MHTKLISSAPKLRPPIPENVWQYAHKETWQHFLGEIMKKDCPKDLPNDLDIFTDFTDEYFQKISVLFCEKYTHISAFHATKTSAIEDIYTQGLIPLNSKKYNQLFINIFQNYEGSNKPTIEQLNTTIEKCRADLTTRKSEFIYRSENKNCLK